jgi:hypothetical protein
MIKRFLTMNEILCMMQHGTQPDTIYVKNENGTDTELHWISFAKEYLTKEGNSILFKLRKETIFLSRSFYYYISPLDEIEKEYLRNVIKPFRKEVVCIKKIEMEHELKQRIIIKMKDGWDMAFPLFDRREKKMYRGMDLNRCYTIEELGL